MKYSNLEMSDVQIAYIGGGSRGWAWTFMADLVQNAELSGTIRLYDIDNEAAENNRKIGSRLSAREQSVGKWDYITAPSLKEALDGANFIVISILPGTFNEMDVDVHLPERHGIYQSVGDTAGPGGLVRAMRTLPMFAEIAVAIKEYAPEAWVINYTNPMSLCVKTLYEVFPKIKAFGCCHEVFGTQKLLADIAAHAIGVNSISREDIHVNVLGVNHFTWFDRASYKGIDLFPIYRKFIDSNFEEGYNEPDKNWANSTFDCAHRVKFDLFREYGLIAAAGDRHLAEFMPGERYLKDPQMVQNWKFGLTTVDWRKKDLQKRVARSERLVAGEEEMPLISSGEEGILLIKALCGLTRVVSNVNLPNCGQILGLPNDCVVETNALFSRDCVQPVFAGVMPDNVLKLILPHADNQRVIMDAALTCNKNVALRALLNEPLVQGRLSDAHAEALLDDMLAETAAYLPAAWKK